jgi:pimeloyl-ACP methyl ester carboxylesterase
VEDYRRTIELNGDFNIACNDRHIDGADSLVFIHGFGSAKEHFHRAFDVSSLERFTIVAIDLVGFGKSRGPESFEYAMEDQACVMLKALDKMKIESFHLCAHSMGGLVAMKMAELEPERILSLINMEGNLTPEDCFFSGRFVELTSEEFDRSGRRKFEEELRAAGLEDPAMSEYLETFSMALAIALYKSASHTVADSSTLLVDRLSRIKNACYIYGERNRGVYPGEKLLREKGVPLLYIEGAGHSMATDNPEELYRVISSFIEGLEG